MKRSVRVSRMRAMVLASMLSLTFLVIPSWTGAQQLSYSKGEPLFPAYEGWLEHPDGSRGFLFGYMNENWEQTLHIPIDNNYFSPGAPDQGQPTYFLPRRNRFVFEVPVPEDFGDEDELVWTVEVNGHTYSAHATVRQDYYVDNVVIMSETGALGAGTSSPEIRANEPPAIALEGQEQRRSARIGQPLTLVAKVTDDGQPPPEGFRDATAPESDVTTEELLQRALTQTRGSTVNKAAGLHFTWSVYRGPGDSVQFDPPQIKPWEDTRQFANSPWAPFWIPPGLRKPSELPEDGRWRTAITFQEPGTYVLRGRADDGGLYSDQYITVHVADE